MATPSQNRTAWLCLVALPFHLGEGGALLEDLCKDKSTIRIPITPPRESTCAALLDRRVGLGFPHYPDDLFFAESALFHASAVLSSQQDSPLSHPVFGGQALQLLTAHPALDQSGHSKWKRRVPFVSNIWLAVKIISHEPPHIPDHLGGILGGKLVPFSMGRFVANVC